MLSSLHSNKASRYKSGFLFLYFTFYIFNSAFSQNPLVKQWDYRFGGDNHDWVYSFQQTADGGYILGGHSYSDSSADKTQDSWGGADYWIIKIDSLGNKQWDKDFGGTDQDLLFSLQQTTDGGLILGGSSTSSIGGDKTHANWDTIIPITYDYWIIKIDSLGIKQWDKVYGGANTDWFSSLQQTLDGGYILGGFSNSGISGDKTQATFGSYDYWIVKIDSLGNKQWDRDLGGIHDEYLNCIQLTHDGGYILGGLSYSDSSGNKTQNSWGISDYWIVKIDSSGNKQWDKDFGGTSDDWLYCLKQTIDNGYVLGGWSESGISGDKTEPNWDTTLNSPDYWIIKTDSLGNKQWDKDFGGKADEEHVGNISQTADGGYLIAGTSYSNAGGNKTENNLGGEQTWIVKINSSGNIQWEKTILAPGHDEVGYAIQTKDGCYAIANQEDGNIGGYKTQDAWNGSGDYWIIKFCDTTSTTGVSNLQTTNTNFQIVPNPSNGSFLVSGLKFPVERIEIFNLLGETVFSKQPETCNRSEGIPSGKLETHLPNGIYIIKAYSGKDIFQQKLVINH